MMYGRQTVMDGLRKAGSAFGNFDDRVQKFARETLGEKDGRFPEGDNGPFQMGKTMLGDILHGDRSTYSDDWQGQTALFGSRALQAGGLTAAGASLAQLTGAIGESIYGGPADQQERGQLPLN